MTGLWLWLVENTTRPYTIVYGVAVAGTSLVVTLATAR